MKIGSVMMDPSLAKDGAWCTYMGDMKFKIKRANGPGTIESMQKQMETHIAKGISSLEELPENEQTRIENQVIAEAILCDWENVEDENEDGELFAIPFTVEKAVEILNRPEAVALKEWIQFQSISFDTFRSKSMDTASGN